MEVNEYRIYYVDEKMTSDSLIQLVRNSLAEKIALVVPETQYIFSEDYNLHLLKKYLDRTEKDIVFINHKEEIMVNLKKANFTVYSDLNCLENDITYENNEKKVKNQRGFTKRKISLFLLVLLIIALTAYYYLYPVVMIEIEPVLITNNEEVEVKGSLEEEEILWNEKIIPLHKFEIDFNDEGTISTTGIKRIGVKEAEGLVKIINENKKEVIIPQDTIVMTNTGLKYKITKTVKIPPYKIDYLMDVPVSMQAGQGEVRVEAIEKGENYNVETGQINKFLNKRENVYVVNTTPVTGGRDEEVKIVSQKDLKNLKEELTQKMKREIINNIYQKMGGNYRIIDQEISFLDINFDVEGKEGEIKESISAKAKLKAYGYLIRNSELEKMTNQIVKEKFKKNYNILDSGINIREVELEKIEEKLYNIKMKLQLVAVPEINKRNLAKRLKGKSIANAVDILHSEKNINEFSIKGNVDELPDFFYAIKISIDPPATLSVFNDISE